MKNDLISADQKATPTKWALERNLAAQHPRWRVLVVDDNLQIRHVVYRFLSRFRYDVSQADDGRMALEMFRRAPYDLVVTDLQMPVMNGQTLIARIKAMAWDTPVIVMTGQGPEALADVGGLVSADAVLYKPFDLNKLVATVRTLLSNRKPAPVPAKRALLSPISG